MPSPHFTCLWVFSRIISFQLLAVIPVWISRSISTHRLHRIFFGALVGGICAGPSRRSKQSKDEGSRDPVSASVVALTPSVTFWARYNSLESVSEPRTGFEQLQGMTGFPVLVIACIDTDTVNSGNEVHGGRERMWRRKKVLFRPICQRCRGSDSKPGTKECRVDCREE